MSKEVFILGAKRTTFGKFGGIHKATSAQELLARVLRVLIDDAQHSSKMLQVDEVIVGQVLQAGLGQAPARQAAIMAGLDYSCPAAGVRKECASSLFAITDAASHIKARDAYVVLAGGMENMTRAPYVLERVGTNLGDKHFSELYDPETDPLMIDTLVHDGLTDIYEVALPHMGELAERCAASYDISREEQDAFALESNRRAIISREISAYRNHIVVPPSEYQFDEGIREPNPEKVRRVRPAFSKNGTVTAANASQLSDGAAGLLLASTNAVRKMDTVPLARIVAYATYSQEPQWYTTAPVGAIEKVLETARLSLEDIDLFEINEAFAVVPIHAMRTLNISHEKVNIWGGAIAQGHPIGASGAKIVVTLVHALQHTNGRYGLAVACNGGGEAVAMVVENLIR